MPKNKPTKKEPLSYAGIFNKISTRIIREQRIIVNQTFGRK